MLVGLRVGKHLGNFWAVLWVSGAQNRHFTSFLDTPWTLFARNAAKVYRLSGNPPHIPDEERKNRLPSGNSPQNRGWDIWCR